MARARTVVTLVCVLGLAGLRAVAGPTPGGLAGEGVEWLHNDPVVTGAWGGRLLGDLFYVNDHDKLTIFDVSDPALPVPIGTMPFPADRAAEDLDTNGRIVLLPGLARETQATTPEPVGSAVTGDLYVVDVTNPALPSLLSVVEGAGAHTMSCVLDCAWAYGSDGTIVDLRDPRNPVMRDTGWKQTTRVVDAHDVEEISPGLVVTASDPALLIDARTDPGAPSLLAFGYADPGRRGTYTHTARWPRAGQDRFLLTADEVIVRRACDKRLGAFTVMDTTSWQQTGRFTVADKYELTNGGITDGRPPANALGCSMHWFEPHPSFRDGGIVAAAAYEHGVRFLSVSESGSVSEVAWFQPFAGEASAAYWITDEIVYVIDAVRGLDVLRFG